MADFIINVTEVEEWQTTRNNIELEKLFTQAHSTIVQGNAVQLVRQNADGSTYKFDEMTTEQDLATYKQSVFKYL